MKQVAHHIQGCYPARNDQRTAATACLEGIFYWRCADGREQIFKEVRILNLLVIFSWPQDLASIIWSNFHAVQRVRHLAFDLFHANLLEMYVQEIGVEE